MNEFANLALGYAAGALSTLSPCVLPILPIVLFGALQNHAWGPVALGGGLAISFAGIGTLLSVFGAGLEQENVRRAAGLIMLGFGLVLLFPALQARFAVLASPMSIGGQGVIERLPLKGLGGQFALGLMLGAVWSPCAGPTLGAAVGLAAKSETVARSASIMASFGFGAATPLLALAYGSRQSILNRRALLARVSIVAKPVMGAALALIGILALTGFDKVVEASLTSAMPDWLVAVTTRL